jgi:DNA polymerase III epsilon subunit-like protein
MTPVFLDVETTGVGLDARMVTYAIAWGGEETYCLAHGLVRPDGFEIPNHHIHGITTVAAREFGTDIRRALILIQQALHQGDLLVGHNISFDRRIIAYEANLLGEAISWPRLFCTMRALAPIIQMRRTFGSDYKFPTLLEAYRYTFDRDPPEGLHCARTDMLACREIYFEGQRRGWWQ